MSIHYTEDHEWIAVDGDTGIIGISPYAATALGDVVFVELPEIGREMAKGDEAAVVESVKAASEVYAPIGGEVTEVNGALEDEPAKVNEDPSGDGWFLKIKIADKGELDDLMNEDAYKKYCDGL